MSGDNVKKYKFSILTLNIWGLPWILTPNKTERLVAIAEKLRKTNFDVVCFQELWVESDFQLLCQLTSFPYAHYFHSGVLGSGLAILSKWKIVTSFYHQWPLNGYVHMVQHADWFGGKGVGLAQIKFHDIIINVFNTHLHAQYDDNNDKYLAHRVVQSLDTGLFTRLTSKSEATFFCGDMNSKPGDICYNLISDLASLQDSHNAKVNNFRDWGTCESSRISFTSIDILSENEKGHRLDHIFYKSHKNVQLTPEEYLFPFEEMVPGKPFSYSDHEAIAAKFTIEKTTTEISNSIDKAKNQKDLESALSICYKALHEVNSNTKFYWKLFTIFLSMIVLHPFAMTFSHIFYVISGPFVLLLLFYFLFMATLWYRLETRGLLGAISRLKTAMVS